MAGDRPIVVAGAGLTGATAVATLRTEGFDGPIVLIGAEDLPPYERPPLSKEYLRGELTLEDGFVRAPGWYEEQGIDMRLGTRVTEVDPGAHTVRLDDGERIGYASLLVATGGRSRTLAVPGAGLEGIFCLRTAGDAAAIAAAAAAGARVVCVGMGFIGAEVAASLRTVGCDVAVIDPGAVPLARVLGSEIGGALEGLHRDHGVRMWFGESVDRFEGTDRLEAVVTASGRRIAADLAVVGVGTEPVVEPMEAIGLGGPHGIPVGPALETRAPGIFAAGDVALHDHPVFSPVFGPIRVEHFDNAIKMGQAAARSMLGAGAPFDDPHWFWSDQYDSEVQVAGFAPTWERAVVRGSIKDRSFCAFLLDPAGVVRSVVSMDWKRDVRRSFELIRRAVAPDVDALADPGVDPRTLVPAGG